MPPQLLTKLFVFGAGVALLAAGALREPAQGAQQDKVDFGRQILPILSENCFTCHGPDGSSRKANLRLDTREGALADRGGLWAIVPGKPDKSLLVERINDHDSPMPPSESGKKLTEPQKKLLEEWIKQGADYGGLWSFQPLPAKVAVPNVKSEWIRDDLDRFILARLSEANLQPSKEAAPERWLRRVTLDLTGLPPTEAEIASFLKEKNYEATVDRLLASPHYAERMATEWLDAARYSDSYGYQSDLLMPTWPYRDWVINAFNKNLPYNEFIVDQIAGDRLPHPTRDQILATAFNRLHRQSNEGGSIAEEFKTEYAVDRVSTFGTTVLGLTLGCARCHDHKFDPITQKEFYQLYAYFNSIDEYGLLLSTEIVPTPSLLLPDATQEQTLAALHKNAAEARKKLAAEQKSALGRAASWVAENKATYVPPGYVAKFSLDDDVQKSDDLNGSKALAERLGTLKTVDGVSGKAVEFDGDTGLAVRGLPGRERWDAFTWSFWVRDPGSDTNTVLLHRTGGTDVGFCGFDLTLQSGHLTARVMRHWPGNALGVTTDAVIPKGKWTHVTWSYDGSSSVDGLRLYVNGAPVSLKVRADTLWKRIAAYGDLASSGGDWCFGQRFREAGFKGGEIDEPMFVDRAVTPSEAQGFAEGKPPTDLTSVYATAVDPAVLEAKGEVTRTQQELANFEEGIREISVMAESREPIPTYVLARGQYDAPKSESNRVSRSVPNALPPLAKGATNDRLALARWATSPSHPLTARVYVNRLWQICFGRGIVETSENFGTQGSLPSHPALLDFLARRFVTEGWDVKKALKHIVLSATYRQDSTQTNAKAKEVDPENRLLWRGPSNRLSAEMVRDLALSASGLLVDKLGGPPVNPYQPAGLWQENNTMSPAFVQSTGEGLYRRSLYTTWKRTTPMPSMLLFDATSREACVVRRPATSTPMQAMVLLNDVQYVEAARVLAELVLKSLPTAEQRINTLYLRLTGRKPTANEIKLIKSLLDDQKAAFQSQPGLAEQLLKQGERKADSSLNILDLASWTVAVQAVLNSDAAMWKR